MLVSIDEVGRGCLYGPVVAAAVVMPDAPPADDPLWRGIRDSKKVSEKRRPALSDYIQRVALAHGVGFATPEEIDRHNILQATMLAMHRAVDMAWHGAPPEVRSSIEGLEVDGTYFVPYMPPGRDADALPHTCIPKGDDKVHAIAAASIVAKVARDEWVLTHVAARPELAPYRFEKNKGYGTATHIAALRAHGVQPGHRRSFEPVRSMVID
jgi:ribonuclease HII